MVDKVKNITSEMALDHFLAYLLVALSLEANALPMHCCCSRTVQT